MHTDYNHKYYNLVIIIYELIIPYILDNGIPSDLDISRVGSRVLDELVKPLNDVQIDDTEFACLKAIVFFDPSKQKINLLYCNIMLLEM